MLPDGVSQLGQCFFLKKFSGLGRIGTDGPGREKHDPPRFHIGFQLLALHCHSSLVKADIHFSCLGGGKYTNRTRLHGKTHDMICQPTLMRQAAHQRKAIKNHNFLPFSGNYYLLFLPVRV